MSHDIVILGVFVADTAYRADRQPRMGETILGRDFALGPGGKGSNQAVAAAMAGGDVGFISKLGKDPFADMALRTWKDAGVTPLVTQHDDSYTGAAFIFIDDATGNNAIIISPGVASTISPADVSQHDEILRSAKVFVTQLEQPLEAAHHALRTAHESGVTTILNPAPASDLTDEILRLCTFLTPNESEAEALTGIAVTTPADAEKAALALLGRGVRSVIVTLGDQGCLYHDGQNAQHFPALSVGPVVDTSGAGDAFTGGFATGLAEGLSPVEAIRMAMATSAISVTRSGTAASMPTRAQIDAVLRKG